MSDKRTKLSLTASAPEITGSGDDIKLKVRAHRKKKTGAYEFYEIEFELDRWSVQRLARQIATMHQRDRERLAREAARIEQEIAAIQQPETKATT